MRARRSAVNEPVASTASTVAPSTAAAAVAVAASSSSVPVASLEGNANAHPRTPQLSGTSPPAAPVSGGALDISDMDPWKDDRCRDFIVLNTIQRLRAYHLPGEAPMPEVEPVNLIRSRNLAMLSRATPDYRPCQGEHKPTRAERRARRRLARKEERCAAELANPSGDVREGRGGSLPSSLSEDDKNASGSSSSSSSCSFSSDEESDEDVTNMEAAQDSMTTPTKQQQARHEHHHLVSGLCAIDRARILFFGAHSFTSSTSPRHLVNTPHVPLTPSPLSTNRKQQQQQRTIEREKERLVEDEATTEDALAGPIDRSLNEDLEALFPSSTIAADEERKTADTLKDEAVDMKESDKIEKEGNAVTPPSTKASEDCLLSATSEAVKVEAEVCKRKSPRELDMDGSSPAPKQPEGPSLDFDEGIAAAFSCGVTEVLLAHFQSLLTRGVVLDKLNHKELGFAWWVVGRQMSVTALEGVTRPPRREALLITLRNYYYGMLSENKKRVPGVLKPPLPAMAVVTPAREGEAVSPVDDHHDDGEEEKDSEVHDQSEQQGSTTAPKTTGAIALMEPTASGRSRRAAAEKAKAALHSMSDSGHPRHTATTTAAASGSKRRKAAPKGVKTGTVGRTVSQEQDGGTEDEGVEEGSGWDGAHDSRGKKNKKPPSPKSGRAVATSAKEPLPKRQRKETVREDSPEPRVVGETGQTPHHPQHHREDDDRHGGDRDGHHARGSSMPRGGEEGRERGEDEETESGGGTIPGRGRTHGQQGKAAARRKVIEATWKPLRSSHRHGASVTAPPSEESSNLAAPTGIAQGTGTVAAAEEKKGSSDNSAVSKGAPAAVVEATDTVDTEKTKPVTKKPKPAAKKVSTSSKAAPTVTTAVASQEDSVPKTAEMAATTSEVGGKKRPRALTESSKSDKAELMKDEVQQLSTAGKAEAPLAEPAEAAVDTSSAPSERQTALLPSPAPPQPTEEEVALAAKQAYERATEAFYLLPTAMDRAIEARVSRRMATALRVRPSSSSTNANNRDRTHHDDDGGRERSTADSESRRLPAQSSYAFLLASAAHRPVTAMATAARKGRRSTRSQALTPWESATSEAPPTTRNATRETTPLDTNAEPQQSRNGFEDSADTPNSVLSPRKVSSCRSSVEERTERRGRKKKPLSQFSERDGDGAVDPVLLLNTVRHDQAQVDDMIAKRLDKEGKAAVALTVDGSSAGVVKGVKGEQLRDAVAASVPIVKQEEHVEETAASQPPSAAETAQSPDCLASVEERREALLSTPFDKLPYALQCLVTWEAAELLAQHRRRLAHRHRKRQRATGLQRQKGPMTRRMAALAARGELPSTSSGSSTTTGDDEDDESVGDSDGADESDRTGSDSGESDGSGETNGELGGEADTSLSGRQPATASRFAAPRDQRYQQTVATPVLGNDGGMRGVKSSGPPRQIFDYWAAYRSA